MLTGRIGILFLMLLILFGVNENYSKLFKTYKITNNIIDITRALEGAFLFYLILKEGQ